MSEVFIGLDLSLTGTGVSVIEDGKFSTIKMIKTNPKSADNDLLRLEYIKDKIFNLFPETVTMIAVEDFYIPHNALQIRSAISLIKLGTCIRLELNRKGYKFVVVSPTSVKKFGTGKGAGPKGMMIREVFRRYGQEVSDDNSADAICLSKMAEAFWQTKSKADISHLHDYQKDALKKVMEDGLQYNL